MNKSTKNIALAGLIGALYAALTIGMAPLSYGPVQVRISESLTVLPYLFPGTIYGLYFGCMAANIVGGYGLIDILGGSLLTLLAAILTFYSGKIKKPWLAPLPPVVINAFGVSLYLHVLADMPYWITVAYIGLGQFLSCYGLGLALLYFLLKRKRQKGESNWF
ncbi:QueT transporter family protein [candidate division KSB1 bacterium]|nr:QueT transporter family protein [candidate division KSB1 bacterium]